MSAQNTTSRYAPAYPEATGPLPAGLDDFLASFYRVSDQPEENEQWVHTFTEDADVQIGADKAHGSKGE